MKRVGISVALFFTSLTACCSFSQAQSTFYQGKTIKTVVGYLPGDGFDVWARILSAHFGKHIAGHPEFIVQNMPGASSMIAANYIYRVAKPDGLTIGAIGGSLYLDQLTRPKEVQFDWGKFSCSGLRIVSNGCFIRRATLHTKRCKTFARLPNRQNAPRPEPALAVTSCHGFLKKH